MLNPIFFIFINSYSPFRTRLRDKNEKGSITPFLNNHFPTLDFCLLVSVRFLHSDFPLITFFISYDYFEGPFLSCSRTNFIQKLYKKTKEE